MITTRTAECPVCAADVRIAADAMQNELITCQDCGAELEILSLDPMELATAPETEEDWGE